jgi:hypothetical protein
MVIPIESVSRIRTGRGENTILPGMAFGPEVLKVIRDKAPLRKMT